MLGFLFTRKPLPEVDFLLRVLGTRDLIALAALYGEARDRFECQAFVTAVSRRMQEVIASGWQGGSE